MGSKWIALIEAHIEKVLLGLATVFALYMLWAYMLGSPNRIKFGSGEQTPGTLHEAMAQAASNLDTKMKNATAETAEIADYSARLEQAQTVGIFAPPAPGSQPAIQPELERATEFGAKIEVPGLAASEEAAGSVTLVSPLRPDKPVVSIGRAMVQPRQLDLSADLMPDTTLAAAARTAQPTAAASPTATPAEPETKEETWVTVAAYYDTRAQYNEMVAAKYALYRARPYVVGVDLQRQEMQSNGEWGDWSDVKSDKAMPKYTLPEPAIDSASGRLINRDDIRRAFAFVKGQQNTLMQPPFFDVVEGDYWELPPLAGQVEEEEALVEDPSKSPLAANPLGPRVPQNTEEPRRPTGGESGRRTGGGESGRRAGGGEGGGGGGSSAARAAAESAKEKAEARTRLQADLLEAKRAIKLKEFSRVIDIAKRVHSDPNAGAGHKKDAEKLARIAAKGLKRQDMSGPRSARDAGPELIVKPESKAPAVWFHDDTVESGKTYRYRMRVKLWNRYVGHPRPLKSAEEARSPVIAGDWSYASDPITVTPKTYFFVTGGTQTKGTAVMEVWGWRKGRWVKERFEVAPGQLVGEAKKVKVDEFDDSGKQVEADIDFATNAVVLDVRFDAPVAQRIAGKDGKFEYQQKDSVVVTYIDPVDGQVKERVQIYDKYDPIRTRLEEEAG